MVMAPRFDRGLTVVRFNYSIYMMVSIEVRVSVSCLTFWVLRPLTQSCFEDILYKVVHYFHDVKMILDLIFFFECFNRSEGPCELSYPLGNLAAGSILF